MERSGHTASNVIRLGRRKPGRGLLHEVFEAQADARPDAVAVQCGAVRTSYRSLERRANRLARYLRARGVGRGSAVGLLLPRTDDAYAALLGILKAGAAYVPLDPDCPADRVARILGDCSAQALVTCAPLSRRQARLDCPVVRVDEERGAIEATSEARLSSAVVGVEARDLCYIIYTSGSTGRPKGVMIEHRSARHLARAEGRLFGLRPDDRVLQAASLSFDLSVEEIWLAFRVGATLVAATPEMMRAGPDLSACLSEAGVTVLSSVPTLVSMLAEDVPSLRLLILGGESCPDGLVDRWARPGLRLVNTYGPTETTVTATFADLAPGEPVTIGRPLPGYRVCVLDEALRPVPRGEIGEICIGGVGLARGYVGRPEETRARFVPDPSGPPAADGALLYRSGDLGRWDSDGNLRFVGRRDAQVKIRGYRVELSEIESELLRGDGLQAAACTVHLETAGVQRLVAYVVPRPGNEVDREALFTHLRARLPAYMVPASIETMTDLPRLPSGKIDRAALRPPRHRMAPPRLGDDRPCGDTEKRLAAVWESLFRGRRIGRHDDFFVDLGGHSLLAAHLVSDLRRFPRFARLSVIDLYEHPTIAALASTLEARSGGARAAPPGAARRPAPPVATSPGPANEERIGRRGSARGRHLRGGVLQTLGLYVSFGVRALEWVTPYLIYFLLLGEGHPVSVCAAWAVAGAVAVFPVLLLVAVAVKWMVLGRIRPGRHPLWGGYYVRWWFAQSILSAVPLDYLAGTPLLPLVYRLLGARIGRDVHLASDGLAAFDLIAIGDGACIDEEAALSGYTVEDEHLVLGPVSVGRRCFVGTRAVLSDHTILEDGARLEDLSLLPRGGRVPRGETWAGSPARAIARPAPLPEPPPRAGRARLCVTAGLYALLALGIPVLLLAAVAPGVALLTRLDPVRHPLLEIAAAPLVGAAFVLLITLEVAALKWLLVGRVRAGRFPVHGSFYVRNWMVDHLLALSLDVIAPLHATLYIAPWYRLLGARLGRNVELSTATSTTPDLLEIGDGGTVADEVSLGAARVEGGWMTVAPTRLGRRVFVGNSAVIPAGARLGDGSLVGVLSLPPADRGVAERRGASWLGSPPIGLPRRETSSVFTEARTFGPSRGLRFARALFEVLRVTLPPAGFVLVTAAVVTATRLLWARLGAGAALGLLPLVYGACAAAVLAVVALAKWAVVGRYRPFERPLWTPFVWRLELVNALYEFLATPLALEVLAGTPLLPWYLRLLGARLGRRVFVNTTGFLEWDLVEVGDRAALNEDCVLQTHLFEDRVLKAARLRVGDDCSVGAFSVVLYDSVMEPGVRLEGLSLLMKGETLPAGTSWAGIPASWGARDLHRARMGRAAAAVD